MPTNPTTGTGQVPPESQSPDGNGQVPPTSQDATSATSDAPEGQSSQQLSADQLRDALEKARKDAAKNRVDAKRLAELEAAEQQRADAALSEKERYDKKIAELQAQVAEQTRQNQERVIRSDIRSAADKLGVKPELAYRLLDYAAITFNDDGDPTNISDLLKTAMEEYGLTPQSQQPAATGALNGNTGQQQRPSGIPQTGATNPPRGSQLVGANGKVYDRNEIPKLSDPGLWKRG